MNSGKFRLRGCAAGPRGFFESSCYVGTGGDLPLFLALASKTRDRAAVRRRAPHDGTLGSVARGIGDVQGWSAVEWVAGMGAGLIVAAGILWWRSRSFRDQPRVRATYRTVGSPGSHVRSNLRALAGLLIAIFALTQLLYVGLYIELVQWLLGGREPPRISGDLFFWVLLVSGTCAGGAVYSGLEDSR